MIGLLVALARAGTPEASAPEGAAPAPATPEAGEAAGSPAETPATSAAPSDAPPPIEGPQDFQSPVPLAPLTLTWPADEPAPYDATPAKVVMEVLVDEEGHVGEVAIKEGDEPFASLAFALIRTVRFKPAMEGGEPLAVYVPVTIEIPPPPINVGGQIRFAGGANEPAVGLVVTCAGQSMTTDEEGRFGFRQVPTGEQVVQVVSSAVKVDPKKIEVVAGEAVQLSLYARQPQAVATVVGVYRKERDEVVRRTITAEELRTLPGTMGDPLRAISNLPGAVRTPLDAGWLLVRGGDPRDTGVYIDGIRVPLIYHLGGFTSVVHSGFIDRVDFYPGGQSARYGRATAGAVDLVTRPRAESVEVRAGANIVLAGAYAAVPIGKKASVAAGFRRSYLDAVLGLVLTPEQASVAPRFWDWQFRADYGDFSIFGLGYFDTIDASTADAQRASVQMQTHRLHGSWKTKVLGKPLIVKPYYAFEESRLTIDVIDRVTVSQKNGGGGRIELVDEGKGLIGWSAGVDATVDWFGMSFSEAAIRYAHIASPDAYADIRVGEKLRAIAGVRLDTLLVTNQLARAAPSPRVSVVVPLGEMVTLVADGGMYHQPPPNEMLIGPPEGSTLLLEQSYGGGGGVRINYGPFNIGIDAYDRMISRMTAYEEDGSLGQIQGQAAGLETMVRYTGTRISGWVSYSFARALRREESSDAWYPATYDQPSTLVAVGSADLGKNWTLGARWRFASGFPLPEDDEIEAYDVLRAEAVVLEPSSTNRTEPFHSLDLKISKRATYRHWRLEYYLDVQNVYNRRVAEPVISGVWEAYGTQTYGFGLPVLPILGIEAVVGK